jgi:DNA mismatch repair protein MutS
MGIVDEYKDLKSETDADLLAMQVGDFYEFFIEDARITSRELGLKISEKSSHGSSYPMAGVPIEDLQDYVETLVDKKDYTVAIADQYEENGNHKREITRIVTPGTLVENTTGEVRYLSTILIGDNTTGVSLTDLNSGRILTKEVENNKIVDELAVYDPAEVIISYETYNEESIEEILNQLSNYLNTRIIKDDEASDRSYLIKKFKSEFGSESIGSIGISDDKMAVGAVGKMIEYLEKTKTDVKKTISRVQQIGKEDYMKIDARTRYSLEIAETMGKGSGVSLFDVIDHTVTTNGKEKLQKYLQRPMTAREKILRRQNSVSAIVKEGLAREKIRNQLKSMPNLQRIASKSAYGTVTPRDVRSISNSFDTLTQLKSVFENNQRLAQSPIFEDLKSLDLSELKYLSNLIDSSIVENAPNSVEEGIICEGFNEELDEIVNAHEENKANLENYKKEIATENDISHLSVGRNKTDGFYIQVGNSENHKIPSTLNQVKNLKNSFRYKNDRIQEYERELLRLEEKREQKEEEIFEDIVDKIMEKSEILQDTGEKISHIDAIQSLARHAVENGWTKPKVADSSKPIKIEDGRHPVVEQKVNFVPNDSYFDIDNRFLIVTGPNMAGKSTYLRQIALICILAQAGSYVPCNKAEIGVLDSVFARVGSVDEISKGRSTFMVEMSELANILHSATDESLIILDEVGRGTATCDGVSIARSTIEYLSKDNRHPSPITLFATHYHELTQLSEDIKSIKNVHLPVKSSPNGYEFTHKVVEGPADKSYGVRVADMAGVPEPVIERSKEILEKREQSED